MRVLAALVSALGTAAAATASVQTESACPMVDGDTYVFADMHDGDMKQVAIADGVMTITPYGNNQTWTTSAKYCSMMCTADVDFNVEGKPSPPPCNLTATVYELTNPAAEGMTAIGFTDPTGTITDDASYPLNYWIMIDV
mmetsp:Transcript_2189/g.3603  ORF Transcript_2189/g.3603 Transcript_2189/m.3603 type:complete len:140 (-) Transcript_2189:145-564(-)|eukprot:CAMPEP_0205922346 /NCGR_PEP_ID=MMETSP1325-20131115/14321_1 /ASSEMBLY_ACC=CAM_ASM_000708 /TAXON_ID=236786 /ORGANISM="Florenciella sp., Strain RCC1007" /LENGTH=139 /DNA_ID=CAMNT_0053290337 /DNA_START=44 /DNA_END=463 /DNA_ORIENTATION=+